MGISPHLQPLIPVSHRLIKASVTCSYGARWDNRWAWGGTRETMWDPRFQPAWCPKNRCLKNNIKPGSIGINYNVYFIIIYRRNTQWLMQCEKKKKSSFGHWCCCWQWFKEHLFSGITHSTPTGGFEVPPSCQMSQVLVSPSISLELGNNLRLLH